MSLMFYVGIIFYGRVRISVALQRTGCQNGNCDNIEVFLISFSLFDLCLLDSDTIYAYLSRFTTR